LHPQPNQAQTPNAIKNAGKGYFIFRAAIKAPVEIKQVTMRYSVVFMSDYLKITK
jgi:hypothetical protein